VHRGYLLPEHRRQGIGSAMPSWAEERIRQLVKQHGKAWTAVIGANAMASEEDATALLHAADYRRVFSLVELELGDLQQLPEPGSELPAGIRTGPIGTSHYRAA
jgi:GNAT superfamily N-acetyltransferase